MTLGSNQDTMAACSWGVGGSVPPWGLYTKQRTLPLETSWTQGLKLGFVQGPGWSW